MSIMFLYKTVNMSTIFFFLLLLLYPCIVLSVTIKRLPLPSPGPESFAFDRNGGGPYTSISDGRIVKYAGPKTGFIDFALTSPNRTNAFCDGTNNTDLGPICGRPLGLRLYYRTGELFIADAFRGLCVVGPKGGLATQLTTTAEGVPYRFPDGVGVDQATGTVYFTDASSVYNLSQAQEIVSRGDATGRLIKYDPKTKQVTVLLRGLGGASGVAISKDGSFLLVTEFVRRRIQKYWLKGPKANTAEILLNLIGRPDKIIRTVRGDFWVAVTVETQASIVLTGQRINGSGAILETLTFSPQFDSSLITEVHENTLALYLGSLYVGYVGVYKP